MSEIRKNTISNKETKIKINSANPRNSLISLNHKNQRKDVYGNPISKKIKNHKISFADDGTNNKKLVEIIVVDSYRDFHKSETDGNSYMCINIFRVRQFMELLYFLII